MRLITSVQEGMRLVDQFQGKAEDFRLAIADALLDPAGMNMAMITDRILARGWQPSGFAQESGCRIYSYKELE